MTLVRGRRLGGASADEIDSVDLDELGRQLLRVTVNFRSYTMQIRKLFITPLLDAITGVQADADGPVQIEARDALAEELDNLQENRVAALARRAALRRQCQTLKRSGCRQPPTCNFRANRAR